MEVLFSDFIFSVSRSLYMYQLSFFVLYAQSSFFCNYYSSIQSNYYIRQMNEYGTKQKYTIAKCEDNEPQNVECSVRNVTGYQKKSQNQNQKQQQSKVYFVLRIDRNNKGTNEMKKGEILKKSHKKNVRNNHDNDENPRQL